MLLCNATARSETVRDIPAYEFWTLDPFAHANLTAAGAGVARGHGAARTGDHLCQCGCGLPHNFSVSRLVDEDGARRVFWYRHIDHRNRHVGACR
jgi:hypothetical protein